jgi:hypothetical protein
MMQTVERRETRDEAIVRLALEARRQDTHVKIFRSGTEWFATSQSHPGTLHRLTGYSCDCRGFMAHGRCRHNSALLDHLNWLPTPTGSLDPEPEPATSPGSSECHECLDSGFTRVYYGGHLSDWDAVPCTACDATSTLRAA